MKIPSTIVEGCQFYPRDPKYCVQLVNYRIPVHDEEKCKTDENKKVLNHKVVLYDETGKLYDKTSFPELYQDKATGIRLRLLKKHLDEAGSASIKCGLEHTLDLDHKKYEDSKDPI